MNNETTSPTDSGLNRESIVAPCSTHCSVVFPVSFKRESLLFDDYWLPPNPTPALTVLNYSCGRQSHRIAKGLLRGEIPMPPKLLVVSADPGNEHKDTIRIRDRTHAEFRERGIHAVIAPGPKMLEDLKKRKADGKTRIDNAALWTESGGQSPQKCTRYYKIAPMDRVVRSYLDYHMGVKSPKPNSVERWIGFAWDEQSRCKPIEQKYQQARWPLIEMGESKEDVEDWYRLTGEEMPPPSVCNHCWANGTATFQRISETDPQGFEVAVEFDEESRDMSQFGFREKCYVSKTRLPLVELRANGFVATSGDSQALSCDSGACFI